VSLRHDQLILGNRGVDEFETIGKNGLEEEEKINK
jgi:hypothetical protein